MTFGPMRAAPSIRLDGTGDDLDAKLASIGELLASDVAIMKP